MSPEATSRDVYEDPEAFRNNSIACLRAKAQEHQARLISNNFRMEAQEHQARLLTNNLRAEAQEHHARLLSSNLLLQVSWYSSLSDQVNSMVKL